MRKVTNGLLPLIYMTIVSISLFGFQEQKPITVQEVEVKPTFLPVRIGALHHLDKEKKILFLSLDDKGEVVQAINFSEIKAAYLIQGNRATLTKYVFGGAGTGGVLGLAGMFAKDKVWSPDNRGGEASVLLANKGTWIGISAAASVGAVIGYFMAKGEEDIRILNIYNADKGPNQKISRNLSDQKNLENILPGSFLHIYLGYPADRKE